MNDDNDELYFSIFPYSWQELVEVLNYYGSTNTNGFMDEVMYEIHEGLWELFDYANE